jgi:hypothetical protein
MARNDLQGSLDLLVLKTLSQMGEFVEIGCCRVRGRAGDPVNNYPQNARRDKGHFAGAVSRVSVS